MIEIYPSLLASDFSRLAEEIRTVKKGGADGIHLDIMDGHFVPNITFGPVVIRSIRKVTDLPFWAHLMIENPGKYIDDFANTGVQGITIHAEIGCDLGKLFDKIHNHNIEAGVSIKPDTALEPILHDIENVERIMVMTVNPGFGGQAFMTEPLAKMRHLKKTMRGWTRNARIEVDGGINMETAAAAVEAGADILIAGSAIFKSEDPAAAVRLLRDEAETGLLNG